MKVRLVLMVEEETRDEVQRMSKEENRSDSQMGNTLLVEAIKARRVPKKSRAIT